MEIVGVHGFILTIRGNEKIYGDMYVNEGVSMSFYEMERGCKSLRVVSSY